MLVNAVFVLALLGVSILATPRIYLMSAYKVPAKHIQFTETAQTYLMDDYVDPELASPYRKQFVDTQKQIPRRYNFNFSEDAQTAGPKSLYIPSTSAGVTSLVNGIPFNRPEDIDLGFVTLKALSLFSHILRIYWCIDAVANFHSRLA